MITKLNHKAVLHILRSGDVASKDLYYHDKCFDTIRYQYGKFAKSEPNKCSSVRDTKWKQIALKKVIFYLKDSKSSNSRDLYPVMVLETMYSDRLKSDCIYHNNHSTTLADLLVKYVSGLNKKTGHKSARVFFFLIHCHNWIEHLITNLL